MRGKSSSFWNKVIIERGGVVLGRLMKEQRTRGALMLAGANVVARLATVMVTLLTIPQAYQYLGTTLFGIWMTLSSFIGFLAFADLGMGNGVINAVASARARADATALGATVSSAYVWMVAFSVVLGVVAAALARQINLADVYHLTGAEEARSAATATVVFAILFLANLPAALIQKIQWGMQEGYLASCWQIASSVLTIVTVPIAIARAADLWVLVACLFGAQVLCNIANTISYFVRKRSLRPRLVLATSGDIQTLLKTGLLFLVLQLAVAFAYQSDYLVIINVLGPEAVSEYSIAQRLFQIISVGLGTILGAFWPAYSDAVAKGDTAWVKTTFLRSLLLGAGASIILSLTAYVFFADIVTLWVGEKYSSTSLLIGGLAIWVVIDVLGNVTGTMLNASNVVRFQIAVATPMALVAFALKWQLVAEVGVAGAVIATIIAYTIISIPAQYVYIRRYVFRAHQE